MHNYFCGRRKLTRSTNQLNFCECWGKCKSREVNTPCHSLLIFLRLACLQTFSNAFHNTKPGCEIKMHGSDRTKNESGKKARKYAKPVKIWAGNCEWGKGVEGGIEQFSYCFKNWNFFTISKLAYLLKRDPKTEDKQWRLLMRKNQGQ